jgi:hypothetical protein
MTRVFAAGRLAFGVALTAAPARVGGRWLGADAADRPGAQIALRGLGARDLALSLGALACADEGSRLRPWLAATAACDLADLAATLLAPARALPANARWGTAVLAGGSALAGVLLYAASDG